MTKLIFQTWKEDPTGILKKCADSWKEYNPDWEYVFLNDKELSNIVKKINPGIFYKYENDPIYIKKFDAYRYAYIYEFGGLYADIDIICHRSIDSLISPNKGILFQEYPCGKVFADTGSVYQDDILTNSIFYFNPKDKFLKRLLYDLENYTDKINKVINLKDPNDYDNLSVIVETGPIFLTKTFKKYGILNKHVTVEPYSRFEFYSKEQRKQMTKNGCILVNSESYGTHLNVGSWVMGKNKPFSYYTEISNIYNLSSCYL